MLLDSGKAFLQEEPVVFSQNILEPIALIGIGCRFPGASNPQAFWKLLREGVDAVGEVPAERWDGQAWYDPDPAQPGKMVTRWGGFLDRVDGFDWRAFRILPREAKYMDPQHRLLLEVAWEALEDAGLPFEQLAGSQTGVFMGIMWNDYLKLQSREASQLNGYSATGNGFAFAPNRISYTFDLRGPSVAIDSACAASLASVHAACQSLWLGETTLTLAGGVNLMLSPDANIMLSKAGVLSPEGHCKTLDARADGFVRGEGAGIVVLKPLSQVTPSDRVYALIRGTATNHNGRNEWIMATNPAAQEAVLRQAYQRAGIDPAEVDYVELHGTGLPKGDPIEARALGAVVGSPERKHPCRVGSVKSNIGHLDSAAGVASLIKVALSLYHQEIPPTLHLREVNAEIPLAELGLAAQQTLSPWPDKTGPALAGVTAISMAGVNAHVVLESPSRSDRDSLRAEPPAAQLLPLSAHSPEALIALAQAFKDFLADDMSGAVFSLSDICYTAGARRSHHSYRLALVGRSRRDLIESLSAFLQGKLPVGVFSNCKQAESEDSNSNPLLAEAISELLSHRDQAGIVQLSSFQVPQERQLFLEALATLYVQGNSLDWMALYPGEHHCVQLPPYPWQRERLWLEWLDNLGAVKESRNEPVIQKVNGHASNGQAKPLPLTDTIESGRAESVNCVQQPVELLSGQSEFLRRLQQTPPGQQQSLLLTHIQQQVVSVLGLDSAYPLKPHQGLFEAGLNSLGAVELINQLQVSLGHRLPGTLVFEYPTVATLSEYLAKKVLAPESSSSPVELQSVETGQEAARIAQLEQLSDAEAEVLLLEKLRGI